MDGGGGGSDDDAHRERLSRIGGCIERIPVDGEAFKARLGFDPFRDDDENDAPRFKGNLMPRGERVTERKQLLAQTRRWLDKTGRTREGHARCPAPRSCPGESMAQYLARAGADTPTTTRGAEEPRAEEKLRGSLVTERTPCALSFYHRGVLFEGEIRNQQRSDQKPDHSSDATLFCAGYLYFQLWWFRTKLRLDVTRAYGFSVTGPAASHQKDTVSVSLLLLDVPESGAIGGRYPLYEYATNYKLRSQSSETVFAELGQFLFSDQLPNPFESDRLPSIHSLGCMLAPRDILNDNNQHGWEIVPTVTGSLVIRCQNAEAVMNLLGRGNGAEDQSLRDRFRASIQDEGGSHVWYLKCKTPSFGLFWDTAQIAVNVTRGRLCQQSRNRKQVQWWLRMHPLDSLVTKSRSITVVRSMGKTFRGELTFLEFNREVGSLIQRTLDLQSASSIVHGDIYEGNVTYDSDATQGSKLTLIDWDEGLRFHPCTRVTETEEERTRYPNGLVSFPEHYTKHQLVHLYSQFLKRYYNEESHEWDCVCAAARANVTGQLASVEATFKSLERYLETN